MGSPAIAGWIAHVTFWFLLIYGWLWQEIGLRGAGTFLLLWLAGYFGLAYLPYGGVFFSPFVAALDIALVFIIFKGDVRLT
jgi:hypothetical protein